MKIGDNTPIGIIWEIENEYYFIEGYLLGFTLDELEELGTEFENVYFKNAWDMYKN